MIIPRKILNTLEVDSPEYCYGSIYRKGKWEQDYGASKMTEAAIAGKDL